MQSGMFIFKFAKMWRKVNSLVALLMYLFGKTLTVNVKNIKIYIYIYIHI